MTVDRDARVAVECGIDVITGAELYRFGQPPSDHDVIRVDPSVLQSELGDEPDDSCGGMA